MVAFPLFAIKPETPHGFMSCRWPPFPPNRPENPNQDVSVLALVYSPHHEIPRFHPSLLSARALLSFPSPQHFESQLSLPTCRDSVILWF